MKIKYILLVTITLVLTACVDKALEAVVWTEIEADEEPPGTYHLLEEDGTKIFLPHDFTRYSVSKFQKVLDSVLDGQEYESEIKRINKLKDARGSFYIYFDDQSRSSLTVSTVEYMQIEQEEAQTLLGMIRSHLDYEALKKNIEIEKVTAKYSGDKTKYVFKSVYKLTDLETNTEWYNSSYIITSNLKTVFIQLVTSFEADFDPYILKTIL